MYRVSSNYLTVRTCSTYHDNGGTVYNVTGILVHGSYDPFLLDYDVAVLKVCIEFNMPIDSEMFVRCVCCDISLYLISRRV